jgi:hypothetical protein
MAPDRRVAFVPEGPCDRSLARSAWDITIPRNRPVGYGLILAGVRTSIRRLKYWSDQVSEVRTEENPAVQEIVHNIEEQLEHHRAFRARLLSSLSYGTLFDEEGLWD